MTCVIGMVKDGRVYMGGDSCVTASGHYRITAKPKVFVNGDFIIGYTTSTRMGDLLRTCDLPKGQTGGLLHYMINIFVPEVRNIFKDGGFAKIENSVESGGQFLIGTHGQLFEIDSDFQVEEYTDGLAAVGSGQWEALSALRALIKYGGDIHEPELVIRSLEIAGEINCYVRPPYYCEKIGGNAK